MKSTHYKSNVVTLLCITIVAISVIGCVTVQGILAGADAALKAEIVADPALAEYLQPISLKVEMLDTLYGQFKAAEQSSRSGISSEIEAAVKELAADDAQILELVQIKNPQRKVIVSSVIAAVEAAIVAVQDQAPSPSGNSVQLNSTVVDMKAAVNKM